jgi:hypothetical protein
MTRAIWHLALLSIAASAACGGDGGVEDELVDCVAETRDDDYVAGMVKSGERLSFALIDADPAPPDEGDNTWTLHVADGETGVEGLTLTVDPWMPDHDHGTPIAAVVTEGTGGDYTVAPINLWLAGLWEVTIEASDGESTDTAVFAFCIEDD